MQKSPEDDDSQRSRPSSRRSSVSLPRKNSLKKERKSPLPTPPTSSHSTPKRTPRPSLDLIVTGKQILKRPDRANSLPGYRRQISDSPTISNHRARRISERAESQASVDELSLDLSQVSEFEETPLASSTPFPNVPNEVSNKPGSEASYKPGSEASHKPGSEASYKPGSEASYKSAATARPGHKPRSASLQHMQQKVDRRPKTQQSVDLSSRRSHQSDASKRLPEQPKPSRDSTFSYSRDSLYKTSSTASTHRYNTDCSSVSPEYSQSSTEVSPRNEPSPVLSSCTQSWDRTVEGCGEWSRFWAQYNHALPRAPLSYDQCPTPYRQDSNMTDFDWSIRSPDSIQQISSILQREGLRLTPRDTQHIIRCAHLLGNVLSRAIDKQHSDIDEKKKNLTLDLKKEVDQELKQEVVKSETVMTQTDISLPNTKSAPLIFENILRQLSKSSIDEPDDKEEGGGAQDGS